MSLSEAKDRARVESLAPGRDDLRKLPGYWERPAKVHRTGVGMVDGYEWGVKFAPNDGHGRLSKTAQAVGEMMSPSWYAGTALEADARGFPGDYGLKGMSSGVYAADVQGEFCPTCDRLRVWCECGG